MPASGRADEEVSVDINPPKLFRVLCLALSLLAGGMAAAGVALLPLSPEDLKWFGVAFQAMALFACFFTLRVGLGRCGPAPALTMLTVGGAVFVAATLSEKSLSGLLAGERLAPTEIRGISLLPFAVAQALMGLSFMALSGATVLMRRPRLTLPTFLKGVAFGLPVLLVLGSFSVPIVRREVLGMPKPFLVALLVLGGIALGALVAVSGHLLIRAFELGQPDDRVVDAR